MVSVDKNCLPVFARFPFDVTVSVCFISNKTPNIFSFCSIKIEEIKVCLSMQKNKKEVFLSFLLPPFSLLEIQKKLKDHILMGREVVTVDYDNNFYQRDDTFCGIKKRKERERKRNFAFSSSIDCEVDFWTGIYVHFLVYTTNDGYQCGR